MEDQQTHLQDEPPVGGRHDGHQLRRLMERKQVSVQEFAELYLQKSKAVAYSFLRKAVFTREELAMICYLFDCSTEDFGQDKNYLLTGANKNRLEGLFNNVAAFHSMALADIDANGGKTFIEAYFNDLARFTREAKSSLRIFHYLSKKKNTYRAHVLEQIKAYYEAIEQRMHEMPELKYSRFFALPIQIAEKIYDAGDNTANTNHSPGYISEDAILSHALEIMLPETIRHLTYCCYHFDSGFSLYAINIPPRLNSFTIVDQHYVISEYDRINRYAKVSHDLMFVDQINTVEANDPIAMLLKSYSRDLDNLAINLDLQPRPLVRLEKILELILTQIIDNINGIEKLEKELKEKNGAVQGRLFQSDDIELLIKINQIKTDISLIKEKLSDWEEKRDLIYKIVNPI